MLSYVNRISSWFKASYPEAQIKTVNAGISDTATNFGIYRLEQNLMNTNGHDMPDLVFVEFTTNDFGYATQGKAEIKIQAESIFRSIWSHNPYAEIVMISTNVYAKSQSIAAYREVCEYYGISFIDVGGPLQNLKEGRGHGDEKSGYLYYTADNLHPSAKGYEVYFDIIKPVLAENLIGGDGFINYKENLPKPLSDKLISNPILIKAEELNVGGNAEIKPGSLVAGMYGTELTVCRTEFEKSFVYINGESEISAEFCGSALGILVDLSGVGFELGWQIDGGEWKQFEVNKNHFSFQLYEHPQVFMFEHHLDDGAHTVTFKFSGNTEIKLGGLIVKGGK